MISENKQAAVGCKVNPKVIGIQQPRSTKKDGFTTFWLPPWRHGIMPGKVAELHLYFGRDYHVVGIGPREVLSTTYSIGQQIFSVIKK